MKRFIIFYTILLGVGFQNVYAQTTYTCPATLSCTSGNCSSPSYGLAIDALYPIQNGTYDFNNAVGGTGNTAGMVCSYTLEPAGQPFDYKNNVQLEMGSIMLQAYPQSTNQWKQAYSSNPEYWNCYGKVGESTAKNDPTKCPYTTK